MRFSSRLLLPVLFLIPIALCNAQEKAVQPEHAPDGGTIERFASIFIPSMADAPFTATVNTEWVRLLPDGSTITLVNHRTVARDTSGRIYQERAYFVPYDGKHDSFVTQIEISDPAAGQIYICRTAEHVCRLREFSANVGPDFTAVVAPTKAGLPGVTVESLGAQNVAGLETVGTRETRVLGAATIGNEAPILERKEFWYSAELGINLITKREDAKFSTHQNFEVSNISRGEPDAKLFTPPAGYKILDLRNPPEISGPPNSSPQ